LSVGIIHFDAMAILFDLGKVIDLADC